MLKDHLKKGALGVASLVALSAVLSAGAQTAQSQTGTVQAGQTANQQPAQTTAAGAASALNAADQRMLKAMAINNMAEIEAGRMAHTKTRSDEVKTFAQRMIDDHTRELEDVRQLAQAKGVSLPTELDRTNKRKAARLAALSGETFDRAYMAQAGVADHKRSHILLRQAQTRAKDPDLQALAARMLPVVDQHLDSAQELHKHTTVGSSRTQGKTGSSPGKQE